jgi:hypothetical protein
MQFTNLFDMNKIKHDDIEINDLEKAKLSAEIDEIRFRTHSTWSKIERAAKLLAATIAIIGSAYFVIEYAEPIFQIQKKEYQLSLESYRDSVDALRDTSKYLRYEMIRLEHVIEDIDRIATSRRDSLQSILAMHDTMSNSLISELNALNSLLNNGEYYILPNEKGLVCPFLNFSYIGGTIDGYSFSVDAGMLSSYMLRIDNSFWVTLNGDPRIFSPFDGFVLHIDSTELSNIAITIQNAQYEATLLGITDVRLSVGDSVKRAMPIGIASMESYSDYRTAGVILKEKNSFGRMSPIHASAFGCFP